MAGTTIVPSFPPRVAVVTLGITGATSVIAPARTVSGCMMNKPLSIFLAKSLACSPQISYSIAGTFLSPFK